MIRSITQKKSEEEIERLLKGLNRIFIIGCGTCTENVCFADAIAINDERAVIGEGCRGCGRCVDVCPTGAIELRITDPAFADRTLDRLLAAVDLR